MKFVTGRLGRLQHASDETLARSISGELHPWSAFRVNRHLGKCWQCRARRDLLEAAAMRLTDYRNRVIARIPENPSRRYELKSAIRRLSEESTPRPLPSLLLRKTLDRFGVFMNPAIASFVIIVVAVGLLAWIWLQPRVTVSAAEVLDRVQNSEGSIAAGKPGVIYQKLRITVPNAHLERELYRDVKGLRVRRQDAAMDHEPIRRVVSSAGVDWDNPLSAESFRAWHDRQSRRLDRVEAKDGSLLTITTESSDGAIKEESFTVRVSDYHPVGLTIRTNTQDTIEIAELNYAVLDWSAVNESLFEPLSVASSAAAIAVAPDTFPTPSEVDNAQLTALLTLNRLNADEGEQISLSRTDRYVEIKGVVETSQRKQELVQALRPIAHLRLDILSLTELTRPAGAQLHEQTPAQAHSVQVQASPLEKYLQEKRPGADPAIADLSQRLLNAALQMRQSSRELAALSTNFNDIEDGPAKQAAYRELVSSYTSRILTGAAEEDKTLKEIGFDAEADALSESAGSSLVREADRNETLCRELISGSDGIVDAADLVPQIFNNIAAIRALLSNPQSQTQQP